MKCWVPDIIVAAAAGLSLTNFLNWVSIAASPPRLVTVEELLETAKGVTNMALAHEIVVNGDFRINAVELAEGRYVRGLFYLEHFQFWDWLPVPCQCVQVHSSFCAAVLKVFLG